jgi:putative tryptophan/tyrosine transport system substrate-binding protein
MQRREFITLAGCAAAAWPVATRAQNVERQRRIGVLFAGPRGSGENNAYVDKFTETLSKLGWTVGQNIQIDFRWADNDLAKMRAISIELLNLKPDVILAVTTPVVAAFQANTNSIPIVFTVVSDPVASGFVQSFAHPGGNITGFSNFEPTLVGKYIEILKEINQGITSILDMSNPDTDRARTLVMVPLLEAAARYYAVELINAPVRSDSDIERVITNLADKPAMGLIVAGNPFLQERLRQITTLAQRYRVAAIYSFRFWVDAGGLVSYGIDLTQQFPQAAVYIDRILKGANPADLPVQAPTKFEMVINLKTAKAMGLTIPPTLLARADEVIE